MNKDNISLELDKILEMLAEQTSFEDATGMQVFVYFKKVDKNNVKQ